MNALNIARQQYQRGEITVEEMQTAEREAVTRAGENARRHVEEIMGGGLPALRGAGPATRPGWTEIEGGEETPQEWTEENDPEWQESIERHENAIADEGSARFEECVDALTTKTLDGLLSAGLP